MSETLTFTLRFLSDWHVGDGAGARGHVDAVVRRHPEDDLPYCPAKTLTGILRDGCERIAYGLDRGDAAGPWHALLREVFGSNQQDPEAYRAARAAKLSVGPARFAAELRDAIAKRADVREALVLLKPGVKLDDLGVAQSQMLRFQEVVLAGAELTAGASLALSGPRRRSAVALLTAGASAVDRLGAKRRRGTGRCELVLDGGLADEALYAALKESLAPAEEEFVPVVLDLGAEAAGSPGPHWRVVCLALDLQSPVIVPADTLGNMVTTHDHIPGSLLVPALNPWLRELLGDKTTGALARGAVQVRNAYLAAGARRLLPVPAALFKLKEGTATINQLHGAPGDKRQRKQVRAGFVAVDGLPLGDNAALLVETLATTHATIDDSVQRPTAAVGGVYSYKALRPGQRLLSELWIDTAVIPAGVVFEDWLNKQAPKSLRIGRAKKDDYGRVALSCQEVKAQELCAPAATGLTLWLASPLLLRDEALAPVLNAQGVAQALSAALGVSVRPRSDGDGVFLRPWRDDGWNNAWQMRRPTRFGLAPGSCFAFEVEPVPSADALARLQARGLGERRGEGYGEVVFNAPLLAEPPQTPLKRIELRPHKPPRKPSGNLQPTSFSRALQRRAGRLAIRRKALEQDAKFRENLGWRSGDAPKPPNTQLGALRALMESLHDADGLARIQAWLEATQANAKRQDKWPAATVTTLRDHIDNDKLESIWTSLEIPGGPEPLPDHNRRALAAELRIEAIKTLWLTAISRQINANNRASTIGSARQEANHGA